MCVFLIVFFLNIQDHSLPVQVFVKSGEKSERPASPCLSQSSTGSSTCSSPVLCSTPKSSPHESHAEDDNCQTNSQDDTGDDDNFDIRVIDTADSPQEENEMGTFSLQTLMSQLLASNIFTPVAPVYFPS